MKILWIDDIRKPPQIQGEIHHATNYEAAIAMLCHTQYDMVCFDHDLGDIRTGYDIAKWCVENDYPKFQFYIQSSNPVGRRNIQQLLTHYGYKEIFNL